MNIQRSVGARIGVVLGAAHAFANLGCSATPELDGMNGPSTSTGGGTSPGSGGFAGQQITQPTGTPIPCDAHGAIVRSCQPCHGQTLIGGAPLHLVTWDDFARNYTAQSSPGYMGQSLRVSDLARLRLNSPSSPMPPGGQISPADKAAIDAWLGLGAPAGTEADRFCGGSPGTGGSNPGSGGIVGAGGVIGAGGGVIGAGGGVPGTGGSDGNPYTSECDLTAAYEPLVPQPGETCYELPIHGAQGAGDTSKYTIGGGEHYQQFYYRVPWPSGSIATRFGARFENVQVAHHWLLFTSPRPMSADGTHETVLGTQLLDGGSQLLAGWAVGGCNVAFPPDLGLELPPNGTILNVQWHFYNYSGAPVSDGSAVQICTAPAGSRPNVGSLTWLGTENFNGLFGMPTGMQSEFGGTCINDSNAPITIWGFWPHMHQLGRNMRSVVRRTNGAEEEVFNKPFDFNRQIHYENRPYVVLQPGDSIHSTCTFFNDTGAPVTFGPSSNQEMCYQFAFSYPARALDNGVISLIGATNTCWQPGQ